MQSTDSGKRCTEVMSSYVCYEVGTAESGPVDRPPAGLQTCMTRVSRQSLSQRAMPKPHPISTTGQHRIIQVLSSRPSSVVRAPIPADGLYCDSQHRATVWSFLSASEARHSREILYQAYATAQQSGNSAHNYLSDQCLWCCLRKDLAV